MQYIVSNKIKIIGISSTTKYLFSLFTSKFHIKFNVTCNFWVENGFYISLDRSDRFYLPIAWQRTDSAVKVFKSSSHKPILADQWSTSSPELQKNAVFKQTQLSFKTDKSGTIEQTLRQLKWKYSHASLQNSRPHLSANRSDSSENKRKSQWRNESPTHIHTCLSILHWVYVEGLVVSGWHLSLEIPINANQSFY